MAGRIPNRSSVCHIVSQLSTDSIGTQVAVSLTEIARPTIEALKIAGFQGRQPQTQLPTKEQLWGPIEFWTLRINSGASSAWRLDRSPVNRGIAMMLRMNIRAYRDTLLGSIFSTRTEFTIGNGETSGGLQGNAVLGLLT